MCFKIHPTFLDWIHLIPGFYYILEISFIFDDGVGYIHRLFLGAQEPSQFLVFSEVTNLVKNTIDWALGIVMHLFCVLLEVDELSGGDFPVCDN